PKHWGLWFLLILPLLGGYFIYAKYHKSPIHRKTQRLIRLGKRMGWGNPGEIGWLQWYDNVEDKMPSCPEMTAMLPIILKLRYDTEETTLEEQRAFLHFAHFLKNKLHKS
ncbi:MAG: hypothetical protein PF447_06680, partial [Spirochaetaceae bacterium]|nr:hypothetical protein [Spirochaetaceae bacterium]